MLVLQYLFAMKFLSWLLDQIDEPTRVGRFGKVCWDDINNGCASTKFGPMDWRDHFNEKHPSTADNLNSLLVMAYSVYIKTLDEN